MAKNVGLQKVHTATNKFQKSNKRKKLFVITTDLWSRIGFLGDNQRNLAKDTLFNDPTRDSIANNFVISFYCRCLQILYQIAFFYKI